MDGVDRRGQPSEINATEAMAPNIPIICERLILSLRTTRGQDHGCGRIESRQNRHEAQQARVDCQQECKVGSHVEHARRHNQAGHAPLSVREGGNHRGMSAARAPGELMRSVRRQAATGRSGPVRRRSR